MREYKEIDFQNTVLSCDGGYILFADNIDREFEEFSKHIKK